ncbi:hypothetical protein, partial [Streptomyces aureus]
MGSRSGRHGDADLEPSPLTLISLSDGRMGVVFGEADTGLTAPSRSQTALRRRSMTVRSRSASGGGSS